MVDLIMTGDSPPEIMRGDDFNLTQNLGLLEVIQVTPTIAKPLYREVIARTLSMEYQLSIPAPEFVWKHPDGALDVDALLREFQHFWRRHGDLWEA